MQRQYKNATLILFLVHICFYFTVDENFILQAYYDNNKFINNNMTQYNSFLLAVCGIVEGEVASYHLKQIERNDRGLIT